MSTFLTLSTSKKRTKITRKKLWEVLQEYGIDSRLLLAIESLTVFLLKRVCPPPQHCQAVTISS